MLSGSSYSRIMLTESGMHVCVLSCFSHVRLCDTMDCSLPGPSVHGISQTRILEWVAMPSSRGSSQPRDQTHISCGSCVAGGFFTPEPPERKKVGVKLLSHVQLFATPWMVAYQAPLSMGFSRQEYWSGCHFLLQVIFPTQGSNLGLLHCR